jgi:hypothetical protein
MSGDHAKREIVMGDKAIGSERTCWGPSASEGPQKHDLTMFSK